MDINRVEQTSPFSCGSACLAMVLDKSVGYIEQNVLRRTVGDLYDHGPDALKLPIGVTIYEMEAALHDYGFHTLSVVIPCSENPPESSNWFHRIGDQLPILRPLSRINNHINNNEGVAILGVPSLIHKGGLHWIVVNKRIMYDPAPGDGPKYENLGNYNNQNPLYIHEAILIYDD